MSHRSLRTTLAASHQRSWLWGRHAVTETLKAGRWPVLELYGDETLPHVELAALRTLAASHRRDIRLVPAKRLTDLCRAQDHQGYLARMGEFPCGTLGDLSTILSDFTRRRATVPLFVICDRIQDAHNFGAILRCCDAMKVDCVIIGERSQASVTPHVARSSAGAVNFQTIIRANELTAAVDVLKKFGVKILAATEKTERTLWEVDLRQAVAVVIGTESTGIEADLLSHCNQQVSIPMLGHVTSLNAAVAAGIILCECRRQQATSTSAS